MRKILILVTALFLVACSDDPRVDMNIGSIGRFNVICIDGVEYLSRSYGQHGYGLTVKFGRDGEVSLCDLKGEWQ